MKIPEKLSDSPLPTNKQLFKSAAVGLLVWVLLYICVILPAEEGKDITGLGKVLDLTEMGNIKKKLLIEANSDNKAFDLNLNRPSDLDTKIINDNKDAIEIILKPDEAIEIKLEMKKGRSASYNWVAKGGGLNYNLHGDGYMGSKQSAMYKKGKMVDSDQGVLDAQFDGYHGWFWRNRNKVNVSLFLDTQGDYIQIKRMK